MHQQAAIRVFTESNTHACRISQCKSDDDSSDNYQSHKYYLLIICSRVTRWIYKITGGGFSILCEITNEDSSSRHTVWSTNDLRPDACRRQRRLPSMNFVLAGLYSVIPHTEWSILESFYPERKIHLCQ